jgi:hypothetical protein
VEWKWSGAAASNQQPVRTEEGRIERRELSPLHARQARQADQVGQLGQLGQASSILRSGTAAETAALRQSQSQSRCRCRQPRREPKTASPAHLHLALPRPTRFVQPHPHCIRARVAFDVDHSLGSALSSSTAFDWPGFCCCDPFPASCSPPAHIQRGKASLPPLSSGTHAALGRARCIAP